MKHHLCQFIIMSSVLFSGISKAEPVGEFEDHGDIGAPKLAGSAGYDAAAQEYAISGSGTNMWFTSDQFHFAWKKMNGDFILRTRVSFIGKGVVEHRKAGWMVRSSLDPDAPYADCAEHGSGLTSLQFRLTKGAITQQIVLPVTNADVLQFERRGGIFFF